MESVIREETDGSRYEREEPKGGGKTRVRSKGYRRVNVEPVKTTTAPQSPKIEEAPAGKGTEESRTQGKPKVTARGPRKKTKLSGELSSQKQESSLKVKPKTS